MYEPYTEDKKIKVDLKRIKEKLFEKATGLKSSKWAMVIVAICVVGLIGGYTGYVSYTSKIAEINSQVMILEKQWEACNNTLEEATIGYENCKSDLKKVQNINEVCQDNIQNLESNLVNCQNDLKGAESDLKESEDKYSEIKEQYDTLETDYNALEDNKEKMGCEYAKLKCGIIGWSYYFIDENEVICCSSTNVDSCSPEKPENSDEIIKINC